jgi:hypothetical protein
LFGFDHDQRIEYGAPGEKGLNAESLA